MDLASELESLRREGCERLAQAVDADALEAARVELLGRQGRFRELRDAFRAAPAETKRTLGRLLGEVDDALKQALAGRQAELAGGGAVEPLDPTVPTQRRRRGSIHPISQVARTVEQVFTGMGFDVVDGPHVETELFNFTRLNIPDDHPARDAQDTFWLDNGKLLRTHTSSVQARVYPELQPPLRKVVVGKVFRYEEVDATHDNTFTQVEGFLVDEGITVAHLVGTLQTMIHGVLQRDDVEVRLRPSFFPFVEPGFEVDVRCPSEGGRLAQWIELLGCGMVHPRVLELGQIDPERHTGFAFGLGLERLAMVRHGIDDIRLFNGADLRGLHQFAG
ncbi:MAG: phenylalanine--tRNA ligase subunit alpha [Planctomycetota bacterium]